MTCGNPLRAVLVVALALISSSSCSMLQAGPNDEVQSELNRQRRRWRAQNIDTYVYTVRRMCFCPQELTTPVLVRVRNGQVEGRTYAESGATVDAAHARLWPAVEGLFDMVQDAIDRDAATIRVEYDAQLGYPTSIWVDYRQNVADEELSFTASDLRRQ